MIYRILRKKEAKKGIEAGNYFGIHRAWKVEAGKAALTLGMGRVRQAAIVVEERQIRESGERDDAGFTLNPPVAVVLAPLWSGNSVSYSTNKKTNQKLPNNFVITLTCGLGAWIEKSCSGAPSATLLSKAYQMLVPDEQ